MEILVLVGSTSKKSINKKLFELIKPLSPSDFEFSTFDIETLPFFSEDIEDDLPQVVTAFKEKVKNADGILFITPEYNRFIPGVLKNAIDWASRPTGRGALVLKPAAVLGASIGVLGACGAQMQLKHLLSFLNMRVMWQPEICFNFTANVNENGELAETSKKFFAKFLESFKSRIEKQLK
jgi:chromate reductase